MNNIELKRLNVDDLKKGDIVAIEKAVTYGWNYFLCDSFEILKISRITPKKTKMYLNIQERK